MFLNKNTNGYYYIYFKCEISNKRKKISCKTKSKSEAVKVLSNFTNLSIDNEKNKSKQIYYLEELRTEVLKYVKVNLRKTTVQIYNRVLNDMIRIIKNKPVKLISIRDIENYKSIRLNEVRNTTVNIDLKTMRAIFNIALKWNWITINPTKEVNLLLITQKEKLAFSETELKIIINNISNVKLLNIVLFASYTGCRLSEILNVQWKDMNFNDKILIIRNKENFMTKTGKIRQIPISDKFFELLNSILDQKPDDKILSFYNPENYIFLNTINRKFIPSFVSMKFKKVLRKLNFPEKFHFHCLRHTFITNLIKSGVNINYVKEIAGHSEIQTTMNYIHIVTDDLREAVNRININ